jgi:ribonucleoside-diphosphate reductase beta chain
MSYGWMLSSLMPKQEAFELVNAWQDNETLFNRNKYIADIYQRFIDDPNDETYVESCVANYLLEGLYFYNGFQFFHTLASRGLAIGSDTQISYIQRDELGHCVIFQHILLILKKEEPELMSRMEESIYEQFRIAADWEIKFSHEIIGDRILGMSKKSITENTYYLGNKRLKAIGLKPIFPKTKNPYKHLDKLSGTENEDSNRTNNFEGSAITYKQPDILKGWEDL